MTAEIPEIQQEIEQTRERLGETVEELAAKADVKARARAKAAEMKAKARSKAIEARASAQAKAAEASGRIGQSQDMRQSWPLGVAAAGVLMVAAALIWRWRKT